MPTANTYNENELLSRFSAGQPDAFTELYRQFYSRIYHFAKRFLPEKEDAEDITADTFVKLWNRKETFTTMNEISAFLHVATRNACFDFLKHIHVKTEKHKELLSLLSENTDISFRVEEIREELMKLIYAEVEKLPKKMKEIFLLSYKEGLKPAEIAQRLNLSVQTVSNQKTTAIKLLKIALSGQPLLVALLLYLGMESYRW